jgi:hypothetical protein
VLLPTKMKIVEDLSSRKVLAHLRNDIPRCPITQS